MEERVKILNSKSQNLAAVINWPSKKTDKLAILCPGFLDTKDYEHLAELAKALTVQGFTVVRFDPTGTWESEGSISEYLTSQYLKDIKSVLEHMLQEGNYGYILLGGHSRGGMVSLLYAARDPRISIVLGIMPSSERNLADKKKQEEWKQNGFRISIRDVPGSNHKKKFKVPSSHAIDKIQFSVFADLKNIKSPIILIAGELDILCTPKDVKDIFNQANEPKKFILMKGIGHGYRHQPKEIQQVNKEIINCIKML